MRVRKDIDMSNRYRGSIAITKDALGQGVEQTMAQYLSFTLGAVAKYSTDSCTIKCSPESRLEKNAKPVGHFSAKMTITSKREEHYIAALQGLQQAFSEKGFILTFPNY